MRSGLLLFTLATLAVLAASACEQRFSANPPPSFSDPSPSSGTASIEALLAPADAGPTLATSPHAMTITLCAANDAACAGLDADASSEGSYLVVFGGGRGGLRSRSQATTDVYKELRDRLASGQHVDAEPRQRGDAGARPVASSAATSDDPVTQAAFRLMDWVDATGAVTLDALRWGSTGCKVSIGSRAGERDASRCLVSEPGKEPSKSPGAAERSRR